MYTNIKTILIIDIGTFIITVFTVMFIKNRLPVFKMKENNKKYIKDLKEGWEAITEKKGIIHLIVTISIVTFFIGFIQTLIAPMMLSKVDVKVLGIIQSFSAIGLLASSIFISIILITIKERTKLIFGLGFAGFFMALLGFTTNIYFIILAIFLLFGSLPYINIGAEVLIRKNIENEKQGRAWGIIGIVSQLGYILAYCISGVLADNIFNPLLVKNGILASSIGRIIGVGQNRGIGLLFIISGVFVFLISIFISRTKNIKDLETI
jgi:MFS family permease